MMESKKAELFSITGRGDAIRRWRERGPKAARNSALLAIGGLVAVMTVFLSLSKAAPAQYSGMEGRRGTGREGRASAWTPEQRLERLTKKLNLSDDQKAKIKPLLEDEAKQSQSIRDDSTLSRDDRRAKFMQLRQATNSQIRSLLAEDQQKKFDKMQQRRAGRWQRQGAQAPANPNE